MEKELIALGSTYIRKYGYIDFDLFLMSSQTW